MDTFHSIDMDNLTDTTLTSENIEMVSLDGEATDAAINCTTDSKITIKGWTKELDKLLIRWATMCDDRASCHRIDKKYYQKKDVFVFFPTIILSTASSIIAFTFSNFNTQALPIVSGILGIISIFTSSLNKYFNFKGLSVQHGFYSKSFLDIANDLKIVHAIERNNRPNGLIYMRKIKLKIDKLMEKAPSVRQQNRHDMRLQVV